MECFYNINEFKLLIPKEFISLNEDLIQSIKSRGIIVPVVISDGFVCDGHKRILACEKLGINRLPVVFAEGNPAELLFELNDREMRVNEIALLCKDLSDKQIADICKKANLSNSPQMVHAVKYLSSLLEKAPELFSYDMPANIWRELGHLGDDIAKYACDLLKMQGTVSEKRNIAAFLRQAQRRGELPDSIKAEKTAEILPLLQKTAQPRRTQAYEKYERALENIVLPGSASLKIDPTFAQPGVNLNISLKRSELYKLEDAKKALEKLFKEVPEL